MIMHTRHFLKQRRFLTVLPLIVLPFLVLLFWILGGGTSGRHVETMKSGLNTQLPDASLKNQSSLDKLSFYAMADHDSVKRREQERLDPNYQVEGTEEKLARPHVYADRKSDVPQVYTEPGYRERVPKKEESNGEIERLEMMMQTLNQKKVDHEIGALNETLDKLLEIQQPTKIHKETSSGNKQFIYSVAANGSDGYDQYFGKTSVHCGNGFLAEETESKDSAKAGTIIAAVHNEQVLLNGSVIKLRLLQDLFVKGQRIPVGSFVFGLVSVNGERLKIQVSSIQFQHQLYPVSINVFDLDGNEGIYIPGNSVNESMKESAEQGIQSIGGFGFNPSLKAQAATVGLNAAKDLLSKKVKQQRVIVKAGYRVLLRDGKDKAN